jgi:hypothetical protein
MKSYWVPFWVLTATGFVLGGAALGELGAWIGIFAGSYLGFLVTSVRGWLRLRKLDRAPRAAATEGFPEAEPVSGTLAGTASGSLAGTAWRLLFSAGIGAILGAVGTSCVTYQDDVIGAGAVIGAVIAAAFSWIGAATRTPAPAPSGLAGAIPPPPREGPAASPAAQAHVPPPAARFPEAAATGLAAAPAALTPGPSPALRARGEAIEEIEPFPLSQDAASALAAGLRAEPLAGVPAAASAVPEAAEPSSLAGAPVALTPGRLRPPRFALPASRAREAAAPFEPAAFEPPVAAAFAGRLEPVALEPPPEAPELRSREAQVLEHHSTWHRLLRPLLYENFVVFLGAFLVLAGSVFGIVDTWNRAGEWRPLLVVGAMALYTHLFFLLGYLLARKSGLHSVALSILSIPVLLLPFLYVGLGLLVPDFPVLSLGAALGLGALEVPCLLVAGALHHRPFSRRFAAVFLALCLAQVMASLAGHAPAWAVPTAGAVAYFVLYFAALRPFVTSHLPTIFVESARAAAFMLGSLLFAWLVLAGHLHFQAASAGTPVAPGAYGPLLVLLAAVALDVHRALREHVERTRHHELWRGLGLALAAGGVALALEGWVGGGGPKAPLPAAAVLATLLLVRLELFEPRPVHLYGALLFSLVAYDTSPALFEGLARAVVSTVSDAAGYGGKPLPLAYYSLTFLPYLLALGGLATFRERRKKSPWPLLGWATVLAAVALALSLSYPLDRRPALAATVLYGLLALAVYRRWAAWGYLAAGLLALPLAVDLALILAKADGPARLLASGLCALGLGAAGLGLHRRREGTAASFCAGLAALGVPLLWILSPPDRVGLDWTGLWSVDVGLETAGLALLTAALALATAGLPCRLYAYGTGVCFLLLLLELEALLARPWMGGRLALAVAGAVFCALGLLLDRSGACGPERWMPWPWKEGEQPAPSGARLAAALAGPALRFAAGLAILSGAVAVGTIGASETGEPLALAGLTLLLVATRRPQPLLALIGWTALALALYAGWFYPWTAAWQCLGLTGAAAALTLIALLFHAELWPRGAEARWERETFGQPARWIALGLLAWALLLSLDRIDLYPFLLLVFPTLDWSLLFACSALLASALLLLHLRMTGIGFQAFVAGLAALWGTAIGFRDAMAWLDVSRLVDTELAGFSTYSGSWAMSGVLGPASMAVAQVVLLVLTHEGLDRKTVGLLAGADALSKIRKSWSLVVLLTGLYIAVELASTAVRMTWSWGDVLAFRGDGLESRAMLAWVVVSLLLARCLGVAGRRLQSPVAVPGLAAAGTLAVIAACAALDLPLGWTGLAVAVAAALGSDLATDKSWLGFGSGWAGRVAPGSIWTVPLAELSCLAVLLWGLGVAEIDPQHLTAPLGVAVLGLAILAAAVRRRWPLLLPLAAACFFVAPCLLLAWYGINYPTGRPDEAILPFFGLVALGLAELLGQIHRRHAVAGEDLSEARTRLGRLRGLLRASGRELRWSRAALRFLAAALAALTAAALAERANGLEALANALLLALLAALWLVRGVRAGRTASIHLGLLAALLVPLYLRWLSPWFHGLPPAADTVFWIGLGFVLLGVWRAQLGPGVLRFPLLLWSLLCPLGLLPWLPDASLGRIGSGLLAAGLLYGAAAWETRRARLSTLAALVLNTGLVLLFLDLGLEHLGFYGLPIGATLLVLVQAERARLSRSARFYLQNLGVGVICVSASIETFHAGGLDSFVLLLVLCFCGIFAGLALRVRAFLFCSTGVLVGTVLGQLVRGSIELALPIWILVTSLGMALIGLTVFLSLKRQQLLAWYRLVTEDFLSWD